MRVLAVIALLSIVAGPVEAQSISVSDAWTRATAPSAANAAGYVTLRNDGAAEDRLVGARSDAAERMEIHTMTMQDGVMRMRQLDGLPIAPGETVTLAPRGLHLMFIGLTSPFIEGESVSVTLEFERAEPVVLDLPVAAAGAAEPPTGEGHHHH